jgi:DNA-binding XRE family transcriptional regulator
MLKNLLKDVYELLGHLNRTGYFADPTPTVHVESESLPKQKRKRGFHHRGPDANPRKKGRKLFQHEVLEIYKDKTLTDDELAELFNVHKTTIRHIKTGETWSKLTGHQK